jgi:hypothetical protein
MSDTGSKDIVKAEIKEIKKTRRALEKNAHKSIKTILSSSETPEKKRRDKHAVKKAMKLALVDTKKSIREKTKLMDA